jgi:hypothetical protein
MVALDGTLLTVFDLLGYPVPNLPGLTTGQRYRCQWLAIGEHIERLSDWKHTSVWVRYHNLEEVVGQNPFSVSFPTTEERKITATFLDPPSMKGRFGEHAIETAHDASLSSEPLFVRSELSHTAWLRFSAPHSMGSEFLRGPLHVMGCLLDLAAGHHLPMIALRGRRGSCRSQIFFSQRRAELLLKRL